MKISVNLGFNNCGNGRYEDIIITEEDIIELAKNKNNENYCGNNIYTYECIEEVKVERCDDFDLRVE